MKAYLASSVLAGMVALAMLPGASAVWPQPQTMTTSDNKNAFVRLADEVKITMADGTDHARIPDDLTNILDDMEKQIMNSRHWPLTPDLGKSFFDTVTKAPAVPEVEITVLELMSNVPDRCTSAAEDGKAKRGAQTPFGGRTSATQPPVSEGAGARPVQDNANGNFGNRCSISFHATQPINMTASLAQLDLAKDTQPPADIAGLDAEMYTLDVPADGSPIKIKAYTALGAYRALQTLAQLVYSVGPDTPASGKWGRGKHAVGDGPLYIQSVPISIQDRPAYGYRGLLLDTSRNWYPLSVMLKLIDGMAVVKMNQLHWHATDTQSWPLAFDKDEDLSRLALNGSYGWTRDETGQPVYAVYTESDVSEVINYGAAHGVNVILEVDMPSHLMSGVVSLDNGNLITCAARDDWQNAGAQPPTGQLNLLPTKDAKGVPDDIGRFVTKVLDKIAGLSQSPYVSSGGDEPNLKCWGVEKEADIDASIIKPFMELVTKVTSSHSKLGMVWEEMGAKFPETAKTLAPGSIVEVWNNATNAQKVLANNAEVNIVLAPYQSFYLDCGGASSLGNNLNPNWCPYVGWQNQYAFDPESVADSVVAQLGATNDHDKAQLKSRFIGGESAIWSEQIDETNLETKVWPRAAAGAEVFWTGSQYTLNSQVVKRSAPPSRSDSDTAPLARILDLRYRMRSLGFNPEPLQPKWCALRPGKCNLQK